MTAASPPRSKRLAGLLSRRGSPMRKREGGDGGPSYLRKQARPEAVSHNKPAPPP